MALQDQTQNGHMETQNGHARLYPSLDQETKDVPNGKTPVQDSAAPLLDKHDMSAKENGGLDPLSKAASVSSIPDRPQWGSKMEFILSVVSFAVGLGNVWRFPYLCYKNGGGAFLIPYLIALICGGVPVFFLEVALGQYMSRGGLLCWDIVPLFKGIGIASAVVVFYLNVYYIVILAWDVYYMVMSFTSTLPWSHCNNTWNTYRCKSSFDEEVIPTVLNTTTMQNTSYAIMPTAFSNLTSNVTTNFTTVDPVIEFWENKILKISKGVDEPGEVVWELALSLLFVWIVCYFCIWKGVKLTGKVVYLTASFPYIMLTILLVRGVILPGAADGIAFYLKPNITRLGDSQVWIDAGTQIFFSYAIALGAMTALGSYNKFNNNCYKHCVMIATLNSLTSVFAGFVVFSVLGFMAYEQGVSVADVAESGPGLTFIAYPKAVTQMPFSPLWAILFFVMVMLLGLGSQFVGMEAFITVFKDSFPSLLKPWRKEIFIAVYCAVSYCIGLTMVTRGGMYVFQLFDYYSASGMSLLWVCFWEAIAVGWIFGYKRYYDFIEVMLGYRINPIMGLSLKFLTPILTAFIFVFMWVQYKPLTYNKTYKYPEWALGLGMCMALSSMICIPLYWLYAFVTTKGTLKERWRILTKPKFRKACQIHPSWPEAQDFKIKAMEEMTPFKTNGITVEKVPL